MRIWGNNLNWSKWWLPSDYGSAHSYKVKPSTLSQLKKDAPKVLIESQDHLAMKDNGEDLDFIGILNQQVWSDPFE